MNTVPTPTRRLLLVLPIVLVVLLSACGGSSSSDLTPSPIITPVPPLGSDVAQLSGQVNIAGGAQNFRVPGYPNRTECSGTAGYSDIVSGTKINVKDPAGAVIGTATLGPGVYVPALLVCSFPFVVDALPHVASYSIEIAQRSGPTYTYEDLTSRGWLIAVALGHVVQPTTAAPTPSAT